MTRKNAKAPHPQVAVGLEAGPFHERIAALNSQYGWMNWMGFASPSVLDNVEFEYFAIRNQSTLFDISPMCKYAIEGADAEAVVNRLVTRDIRKLKPELKVIFVSGYAEDSIAEHQARIPNSVFLPKPFSLVELTRTVGDQLAAP